MFKKHKFNEKKLLHKIGKHWCVISIAILGMIGGVGAYQQNASAFTYGNANDLSENGAPIPSGYTPQSWYNTENNTDNPSSEENDNLNSNSEDNDPNAYSLNGYAQIKSAEQGETSSAFSASKSTVDMDLSTVKSCVEKASDNPDVEEETLGDYQVVANAENDLVPENANHETNVANEYTSDATGLMPTSDNGYNDAMSSASSVLSNDENQFDSDSNAVNSYNDELMANDQNTSMVFDSDGGPMGSLGSAEHTIDMLDGININDPQELSSDIIEASSAVLVANSAVDEANSSTASLSNEVTSMNNSDDSSDDFDIDNKSDSVPKGLKRTKKRKINNHKRTRRTHKSKRSTKRIRHRRKRINRKLRYKLHKRNRRSRIHYRKRSKALPKTFSSYWNRNRYVRAKHGFRAYEIHDVVPEYKSKAVRSKWIKANSKFYVKRRGIEWMWTLGGKGLHHHGHYYWVYNGDETHTNHFKRI